MNKFWILIASKDTFPTIIKHEIYGFSDKSTKIAKKIREGDLVALYLIPKKIVGFFKITDINIDSNLKFEGRYYGFKVKLSESNLPDKPLEFTRDLVDRISIFKDKKSWGGVLMGKSGVEITKKDYNLLK